MVALLELSRRGLKRFRAVCRQAGLTRSPPPLRLEADGAGITLSLEGPEIGLALRLPGAGPPGVVRLPYGLLAAAESSRDEPCRVEWSGDRGVVAWTDRGVPQRRPFDVVAPDDVGEPRAAWALAAGLVASDRELLTAIHQASRTTDDGSHRFALSRIQLQGTGRVVGTDGRQLYRHGGFTFPWHEDLLVPRTLVFGAAEFADVAAVAIGRDERRVFVTAGDWTVRLPIDAAGRFPRTDEVAPRREAALGTAAFDLQDAAYLLDVLPRLPAGPDGDRAGVVLELNGRVAVSAANADAGRTEVRLPRSRRGGAEVRLTVDRAYLARTLELGFAELHHYGPRSPVLGDDGRRQFVWAVMDPAPVVDDPPERIVRLEPPAAAPVGAPRPGEVVAPPNGDAEALPRTAQLRSALRRTLAEATELLRAMEPSRRRQDGRAGSSPAPARSVGV